MSENVTSYADFEKCIAEWKNMDRTSEDTRAAALTFYDEHIFPFVREAFVNNAKNRPDKEYAGLILPLGYSPEPLILSILAIKPVRVGLLYTKETERLLKRIQNEAELELPKLDKREIDGSSTVEVYKAIMELYEKWERPMNIAVDITGGKKSMVGGAAMAGAVLGADIFYVDNTKFTQGKPEPGSEYLSLLDNPYTIFGDLEVDKARDLYSRHDYAGAQRIFTQLISKVSDANKNITYEAYGCLCAAYEAWDNLDIGKAKTFLDRLVKIIKQFSISELSSLQDLESCFVEKIKALEILLMFLKNGELALEAPNGFHFAFMLYHNALRREAQGKLNTACLILYRLLEWIEQHRLARYNIDTRKPNYSDIDEDEIFSLYTAKLEEVFQRTDRAALPASIGLVDGYLLLHALEDEIVEGLDWGKFQNQVGTRNQSIYAHGMRMISGKEFKAFKSTVEERFRKAQDLAGINAGPFNEQHKFITPLP